MFSSMPSRSKTNLARTFLIRCINTPCITCIDLRLIPFSILMIREIWYTIPATDNTRFPVLNAHSFRNESDVRMIFRMNSFEKWIFEERFDLNQVYFSPETSLIQGQNTSSFDFFEKVGIAWPPVLIIFLENSSMISKNCVSNISQVNLLIFARS